MTFPIRIEALEARTLLAAEGALVKDILPGPSSGTALDTRKAVAFNGKLIFVATDTSHGSELWMSDGTEAGTTLLKDINPIGSSSPDELIVGGNYVFFSADDGTSRDVWRTDGTEAGTIQVSDVSGSPIFLRTINDAVVFTLFSGNGLWRTNATGPAAQAMLAPLNSIEWLGKAGNKLLLGARDQNADDFLFSTDGNSASFVLDPEPDTNLSFFGRGVEFNGQLYFGMSGTDIGEEVYVSNGTAGGTQLLADLNPTIFSGSSPRDFTVSGGTVYFTADKDDNNTRQLFRVDGSTVTPLTSDPGGYAQYLADAGGTLFLNYSQELHKLSGNTIVPLGTNPIFLTAVGKSVFYASAGADGKRRLFSSDGTTVALVGGGDDQAGVEVFYAFPVGSKVFYSSTDPAHGYELHVVKSQEIEVQLRANAHSAATIDEGGSVVFKAVLKNVSTKQVARYYWYFEGSSGEYEATTVPTVTHLYRNNLPNDAPRKVKLKVRLKDGRDFFSTAKVTVLNEPPEFKRLTLPAEWVTYIQFTTLFSVRDEGLDDKLSLIVDWGDGSGLQTIPTKQFSSESVFHTYSRTSTRTGNVRFSVKDEDGGVGVRRKTIAVVPFARILGADGHIEVLYGGTSDSETIRFAKSATQPTVAGKINVDFYIGDNLQRTFTDLDVNSIVKASLGPGNDKVIVEKFVLDFGLDFILNGGSGSDLFNNKPIK